MGFNFKNFNVFLMMCIIIILHIYGDDSILKQEPSEVNIITNTSYEYAVNDKENSIGILFNITNSKSLDAIPSSREPYELAIVLDQSGSMEGEKLENAKAAIIGIVNNMIEGDILHVVLYDYSARELFASGTKDLADTIIKKISTIFASGSTNLFDGISTAYEIIQRERKKSSKTNSKNARIFLFSDGLVNVGETSHNAILKKVEEMHKNGVIVSTFGLGDDFDRKLMTSIANFGSGNFFYIYGPEAIQFVINIARKDLESLYGVNAKLKIKTVNTDQSNRVVIEDLFERGELSNNLYENVIDIKDLRYNDHKYVTIQLKILPHFTTLETPISIPILEYELEYISTTEDIKKIVKGEINMLVTKDNNLKESTISYDVETYLHIAKLRKIEEEILRDLDNGERDKAIEKKEKNLDLLEERKKLLKSHRSSTTNFHVDTQLRRSKKALETLYSGSSQTASNEIVYQNILFDEASSGHEEL